MTREHARALVIGHLREREHRVLHPERIDEAATDLVAEAHARDLVDHASKEHKTGIGVFESAAGFGDEREAAGDVFIELVGAHRLLPVTPRVIRHEAGRHRESVTKCEGGGRNVGGDRVIEAQLALVTKREDRRGRERLRHRRNARD